MNLLEFSEKICLPLSYLKRLAKNSDKLYKVFKIPKKSGKLREIESPNQELKGIQRWILDNFLDKMPLPDCVNGFRENRDIKRNATMHKDYKYILCFDIQDFFPSINYYQIKSVFDLICDNDCAEILAKINSYKNRLPQGAVCSPMLSNLVFASVDAKIEKLCNQKRIQYTRYADDLTFSTNNRDRLIVIKTEVEKIVIDCGYKINPDKTRFMSGKGPMIVTGITVNNRQLSIGKKRKKILRAQLNNYIRNGIVDDEKSILGMLSFIRYIEPEKYKSIKNYVEKLKKK